MENLSVTQMVSIRPNRVSFTKSIRRITTGNFDNAMLHPFCPLTAVAVNAQKGVKVAAPLIKKFHNFEISENSQRNLKDKIAYLFQFAKSRRIKTYNGKTIPNFKVCFLTLTLPAPQVHCSADITKDCLDEVLQLFRKRLGMQNYVWRMEFQTNGNIHYHIATDCYIDYFFALKHWNLIIEKKGYITAFSSRMKALTYTDYARMFSNNGKTPADVVYKRWVKGKASDWQNPNTVDVKNAKSSDSIGWYIAKYFSKKEKGSKQNALDNESNSFGLRLCFWSRSLSRCKSESMPYDYYSVNWFNLCETCEEMFRCVYDYARVYYFSFSELPARIKSLIGAFFNIMRKEIAYVPCP